MEQLKNIFVFAPLEADLIVQNLQQQLCLQIAHAAS